ncbi:hypothetical protein JYT13_01185 [Mariprofundus ferrooxydans]|nr:hypothetical protein [Mariprofundus ferrooxydans]
MNKIKVNFENCYGIRKLEADFDFIQQSSYAIYSPNGTMKTSFSKAFMDLSKGEESRDFIFPDRSTKRDVIINDGTALLPEQVFVIEPYNESFKSNKVSTLLVNQELKEKYNAIHNNLAEKKDKLIKLLKPLFTKKKGHFPLISGG